MVFEVLESFSAPKKGDPYINEDQLLLTPHFAGVVDGATSKSDFLYDGCTGGRKASNLIKEALDSLPFDATAQEAGIFFTDWFRAYYFEKNLYDHLKANPVDRCTASLCIYSAHRNEVWQIGDCHCIVNGKRITNDERISRVAEQARSAFLAMELANGKSMQELLEKDTGREYILPLLKNKFLFQNARFSTGYSYCVIDGFPIDPNKILVHSVDFQEVVIATDGYPKAFTSLELSENWLQYLLALDPLCYSINPSTKGMQIGFDSFDDRTYLRLRIIKESTNENNSSETR